jgi:flagellar biosynthesis protein FliP
VSQPSRAGIAGKPPSGRRALLWLAGILLCSVLIGSQATAAESSLALPIDWSWPRKGEPLADPLRIVALLTVLAVLPAIVIATTSFMRTIIVLSMLRQAFGMQETPPNIVLLSLALFLTLFTMAPAIERIHADSVKPLLAQQIDMETAVTRGMAPLREFMVRQMREKDLALILEVARVPAPASIEEVQTLHIIPAFMLSELKTAFQIGFVIFLPFLLLDLVVASVLMSMGMIMVPPTIISLPLKILMFVLIDGWALVVRALLGSFH